jgi:hypothetical protein
VKPKGKTEKKSRRRQSFGWRLFNRFFTFLDRRVAWHKWRARLGVLGLLAFRNILRERNLHDTRKIVPDVDTASHQWRAWTETEFVLLAT